MAQGSQFDHTADISGNIRCIVYAASKDPCLCSCCRIRLRCPEGNSLRILYSCLNSYMFPVFLWITSIKNNIIFIIILFYQSINISFACILYIFCNFVNRICIYFPAKFDLLYSIYFSAAAFTKAPKSFLLSSCSGLKNSGCHCTAHTNFFSGIQTASTSPSVALAITERPGASFFTA